MRNFSPSGAPKPSEGYIYKEQGLDKLEIAQGKDSMIAG